MPGEKKKNQQPPGLNNDYRHLMSTNISYTVLYKCELDSVEAKLDTAAFSNIAVLTWIWILKVLTLNSIGSQKSSSIIWTGQSVLFLDEKQEELHILYEMILKSLLFCNVLMHKLDRIFIVYFCIIIKILSFLQA